MTRMPNYQKGFSLVELTVVGALMAVLAVLLSSVWVGVGRTAVGLIGRSRLVQERDMAIAALSRDLGGCSVAPAAQTGEKVNGRWLTWGVSNNVSLPSNQDLTLTYDGGTKSDGTRVFQNTLVHYCVADDPDPNAQPFSLILVRNETRETESGIVSTEFTVAKHVSSMAVTADNSAVNIVLCFKYRTLTLTCDLTAKAPSSSSTTTLPWSIDHYTNP